MKKHIILFILLFCSIMIGGRTIEASGNTFNFEKVEIEHRTVSSAICISVNSLQDVAIGFNSQHINVYDKNGHFKYGYEFKLHGSYVFKFDDEDNIILFPARSVST